MKFTVVSTILLAAAGLASAAAETNADRMARGLSPLPPTRRSSARRHHSSPAPPAPGPGTGSCNTGSMHCCNSVQDSKSSQVTSLFSLLGLGAPSSTGQVGLTCSPLTAAGVSGNSCSSQPVCCENNHFNGLIVVGCTPININL